MRLRMWAWLLAGTATAFAQLGEISVSAGRSTLRNNSLGSETAGNQVTNYEAATDFRLGFRLTINSYEHFGHEVGYAYNHGSFKQNGVKLFGMSMHQGIYNFLAYATPEGSTVRPFAAGGVHFSTFYPPGTSVFQGNGVTKFGFNYGGGIKVAVGGPFMVRLDARNYTTGKPFGDIFPNQKGLLQQVEISAGFAFMF